MSKAGWYPDPGGMPGMYRFWDGQQWSTSLTSNPFAPPPVSGGPALPVTSGQGYPGQNGYPGQAGAYPGDGTGTQQRRPVGAWAIIGAVVLGLVVGVFALVNLGVFSPFGGSGPVSNPTGDICPKKRVLPAASATQAVQPPGRVQGGKLSYPRLGAPWDPPQIEDRVPFGRDVHEQMVMVQDNYDKLGSSWVASILVGELVAGDGFFSPQQGSEIVSKCIMGVFYGDAVLTRNDIVNKATQVGGKDAWLLEMHLGFQIKGLRETGETAIILIVATGAESSSIYYASIPDSRPELLQTARLIQQQLRVES